MPNRIHTLTRARARTHTKPHTHTRHVHMYTGHQLRARGAYAAHAQTDTRSQAHRSHTLHLLALAREASSAVTHRRCPSRATSLAQATDNTSTTHHASHTRHIRCQEGHCRHMVGALPTRKSLSAVPTRRPRVTTVTPSTSLSSQPTPSLHSRRRPD